MAGDGEGGGDKAARGRSGQHRGAGGRLRLVQWTVVAAGALAVVIALAARGVSNGREDAGQARPAATSALAGTASSSTNPAPSGGGTSPVPAPTPGSTSTGPAPTPPAPSPPVTRPSSPPPPPPAPAGPLPPGPGRPSVLYVVHRGDTMWGITDWALGSSSTPARIAGSWTQIWAANRATIGDNPNLIYPGQRFRVPRLI